MELKILKQTKFVYCGKTYKQDRYVTSDNKYYITSDGSNYVMLYKANKDGKPEICYSAYYKNNYAGYPIYDIKQLINIKFEDSEYTFNIHPSHLTNKTINL